MLTGDDSRVAAQIAEELRISEVHSELLPGDKVDTVRGTVRQKPAKSKLAFVGDGINDAPVLSRADIGIAMGALGSDAAIEAADIVLMDDDPLKISKAIRIARKCIRIVYENIYFAIGIKLLCLLLGAIGIANMWFCNLCGCRGYGISRIECDPCSVCEEVITQTSCIQSCRYNLFGSDMVKWCQ